MAPSYDLDPSAPRNLTVPGLPEEDTGDSPSKADHPLGLWNDLKVFQKMSKYNWKIKGISISEHF